ncbi:hypothetical protein Pyrde_0197 [Pyrodictium delaneyi]|uniref:Protein-glutamine gamma-glutamyltransferase-like C-terminal domain-containing protein n=1 Tax=Pyrodictium delaneyi TaxID=1273541 RepID=A0A0P0N104_9CREN|nr:DUF4129 domain-containing protein [Pyrodictium delaneyi]ALL00247.1 hypothetical protein Pyrde_0197 [Pyrodictium delaneyi]OWJ54328.1 hypothetical protein Pdsh_07540 [Pyrodictium delaneyi]
MHLRDSRRVTALTLLVLVLLSVLIPALPAHAQSSTDLADQLRRLLEQLYNNTINYSEAVQLYQDIASCSQPPLSDKAARTAKVLEEAAQGRVTTQLVKETLLDYVYSAGENIDAFAGCSSSLVYRSILLAFSVPTPAGLLPASLPTDTMSQTAMQLAYEIVYRLTGSSELATRAASIARADPYAGLLLVGLAGRPDQDFWTTIATNTTSRSGLCLVYSLASTDVIPSDTAVAALAAVAGAAYAYGPGEVLSKAAHMLETGDLICYAATVNLLDAAYRGYVDRLLPLYTLPEGLEPPEAPVVGGLDAARLAGALAAREGHEPSILLAALARIQGRLVASPSGLAAVMRAHNASIPSLPSGSSYCTVFEAAVRSILDPDVTETQAAWSVAAAAASLCYADTGSPEPLIALLLFQPFTAPDPWLLAEGIKRQASQNGDQAFAGYASKVSQLAWEGRLEEAASVEPEGPPETRLAYILFSAAVAGLQEGFNPLVVNVDNSTALALLEAAGFESPRDAVLVVLDPARVMEEIVKSNTTSLEQLGALARAASIRPLHGGYVLDYADVRVVSWTIVHMYSWLRDGYELPPPGQPPGGDTLLSWALGYLTTMQPPAKPAGDAGEGQHVAITNTTTVEGEPSTTSNTTANSEASAPVNATDIGVASPEIEQLARQLESLADMLRTVPGNDTARQAQAEAIAELLDQIAQSIREGDYASAVAASQQLQQMLEETTGSDVLQLLQLAQLLRNDTSSWDVAQILAKAASLRLENSTVSIDLGEMSQLTDLLATTGQQSLLNELERAVTSGEAEKVADIIETIASRGGEEQLREAIRILAEESGAGEEVARILEIRGLGDLAAQLYQVLGGQTPQAVAGTAQEAVELPVSGSYTAGSQASNATVYQSPSLPKLPPAPSLPSNLPGLAGLGFLAAPLLLAGLALLAATRYREIMALVARVRLARLERRLASSVAGDARPREARRVIVEAFSQILRLYEAVYAPRAVSETHREYAGKLPVEEKTRYIPAAMVYEKAKFSNEPVSGRDVETLQRILSEIRRVIGALDNAKSGMKRKLLGGRK